MKLEVAVTDAHALIWYARGRWRSLGRRAKRVYESAEAGRAAIYVPNVAVVEVFEAARRGVVTLEGGSSAWAHGLFSTGSFFPVDLTMEIVLKAEELYAIPERGDRLIAATAVLWDLPLITRDPDIEAVAGVEVIW